MTATSNDESDGLVHYDDLTEEQQEELVPTFTSQWEKFKFLLRIFRAPLLLLVINLAVIGGVIFCSMQQIYSLQETSRMYDSFPEDGESAARSELSYRTIQMLLFLLLLCWSLLDCYLFFQWAVRVEKEVQEMERCVDDSLGDLQLADPQLAEAAAASPTERLQDNAPSTPTHNTTEDDAPAFDYARTSRAVDQYLYRTPAAKPATTFAVAFLFALAALALCGAELGAVGMIYIQVVPNITKTVQCVAGGRHYGGKRVVSGIKMLEKAKEFSSLPADVQAWIGNENSRGDIREGNYAPSFVHVDDGSVFFIDGMIPVEGARYFRGTSRQQLLHFTTNGTVSSDPRLLADRTLVLALPKEQSRHELQFCGLVSSGQFQRNPSYDWKTHDFKKSTNTVPVTKENFMRTFCYANRQMRFSDDFARFAERIEYYVTSTEFWLAQYDQMAFTEKYETIYFSQCRLTKFSLANNSTLLTTIAAETSSQGRSKLTNEVSATCISTVSTATWLVAVNAAATLGVGAAYLFFRGCSSFASPASLGVLVLLCAVDFGFGALLGIVAGAVCVVALWKQKSGKLSGERLVWAEYTLLFAIVLGTVFNPNMWDWRNHVRSGTILLVLAAAVAVMGALLLAHPVFDIVAGLFVVLGCVSLLPLLVTPAPLYPFVTCVAISICSWSFGRLVQRYRLHVIVCGRRSWRSVKTCLGCSSWNEDRSAST